MTLPREPDLTASLLAPRGAPLIAVPVVIDGEEMVRYFISEEAADAAMDEDATERALAAFGAWSDMDFDEMMDDLDRIRHSSPPAPPIDLDWLEDDE